jgi:hypothetical protein
MAYRLLADFVLVVHAAFLAFVVFGGLLVFWKRWMIYLHLPALIWGALVVAMGWICPLTPLENTLRQLAGQASYGGGFIEHYLLAAIYPQGLTRELQILLAVLLIFLNASIYAVLWRRRGTDRQRPIRKIKTLRK